MEMKRYFPQWDGCDDELKNLCVRRMQELYGLDAPHKVKERLEQELEIIQTNGFSGLFMLCHNMLANSNVYYGDCYFRGTVGNSFVAFLCGLANTVNPLDLHYRCKDAHYCEFVQGSKTILTPSELKKKKCPVCGKDMVRDGYGLDFIFMTYPDGDRTPDFDFNVPFVMGKSLVGNLKAMDCLSNVVRAGKDTGDGITPYLTDTLRGYFLIPSQVKIEDFCGLSQSDGEKYTNCDYHQLEDIFYKLDILGHGPTAMLNDLRIYTGVDPLGIDLDDEGVKELFLGGKTYRLSGIPECSDSFGRMVIWKNNLSSFAELVKFSGLSHGTDTWFNNADELLKDNTATIKDVIASRDDIFDYCISHDIDRVAAFEIATNVRRGKGVSKVEEMLMIEHGIPQWYIDSCNKIKYLFPRAHSIAYVLQTWRVAYYKVYYPEDFYRAYFDVMASKESIEISRQGLEKMEDKLEELYSLEYSEKKYRMIRDLEVAEEMYDRGFSVI